MKRLLLGLPAAWLVLVPVGPAGAQDTVVYLNRSTGKEDRVVGTIEAEGRRGLRVMGGQEDRGDAAGAGKTYEELASVPDVPPEVKQESEVLVARMLVRAGQYAEAQGKLERVRAALSANDPRREYVEVYLAQCRLAQGH